MNILDTALSNSSGCTAANLSVFHLQAYLLGAQTGSRCLNIVTTEDDELYEPFKKNIFEKYGESFSEFGSIFKMSDSPAASVAIFLTEWKSSSVAQRSKITPVGTREADRILDIRNKLMAIGKRPLMYYRTADINFVKAYFEGVHFVAEKFEVASVLPNISRFETWLRAQLATTSTCPWDMLLTLSCGGDSVQAFARFFERMNEYLTGESV